ncbi:hypothetical protein LTR56_002806 [Elasticomyces elasticus]|nr:hypothetical protein LTR56_002806 [Elasticomyces elasticus]KAK3666737.1 hypothetical protein LTR22_002324 [Elasticomyces elasticus]KAK4920421.1 hypothetical protein LTR49_012013 [Elasticomyces elasticus]KAK5759292.1 hypothetical protein LTS12_010615 [Elasticomyces elasticus]
MPLLRGVRLASNRYCVLARGPAPFTRCSDAQLVTRRAFTASQPTRLNRADLVVSTNSDAEEVSRKATDLVDAGRWRLCNNDRGIERDFKFTSFKATWDFMNEVAAECKAQKHHPEWTNVFNRTTIKWTTHNPEGLSNKDTHMAAFCDAAAKRHGEQ